MPRSRVDTLAGAPLEELLRAEPQEPVVEDVTSDSGEDVPKPELVDLDKLTYEERRAHLATILREIDPATYRIWSEMEWHMLNSAMTLFLYLFYSVGSILIRHVIEPIFGAPEYENIRAYFQFALLWYFVSQTGFYCFVKTSEKLESITYFKTKTWKPLYYFALWVGPVTFIIRLGIVLYMNV